MRGMQWVTEFNSIGWTVQRLAPRRPMPFAEMAATIALVPAVAFMGWGWMLAPAPSWSGVGLATAWYLLGYLVAVGIGEALGPPAADPGGRMTNWALRVVLMLSGWWAPWAPMGAAWLVHWRANWLVHTSLLRAVVHVVAAIGTTHPAWPWLARWWPIGGKVLTLQCEWAVGLLVLAAGWWAIRRWGSPPQ